MLQGFGGSVAANNVSGRPFPFTGPSIAAANTVDALLSLSTRSADVAPYIDLKKVNMLGIQHLVNDMSLRDKRCHHQQSGCGISCCAR
jgi:hypothetical protein